MKILRNTLVALVATYLLAAAAFASDISGSWKWTTEGRNGSRESSAEFLLTDGVLTGSIAGRDGDTAISDATFEEGKIAFSLERERRGEKMVITYKGKLEGDTITGTMVRPGRDGEKRSSDWVATRAE